jgi:SSS family solute:Na+ symporter
LLQQGLSPEAPGFAEKQMDIAEDLSLERVGDRVFPHFIAAHLPPGFTGLLIAAVFAAAMSTISTSLNSSATLVMSDYYRRFLHPKAGEKSSMAVLYGATIAWGMLGTALALLLVRVTESALDIWWKLSGIFGGGITGLFLLGMISRRAKNAAAVTGVLLGLATVAWLTLPFLIEKMTDFPESSTIHRWGRQWHDVLQPWLSPFDAFMIPVVGCLAILLIGLLVSRFTRRKGDGSPPSSE